MKRLWMLGLLGLLSLVNAGCLINRYDSDPAIRTNQLLNESEDLRQARTEVHRFWMNNQPSTMTYDRISGSVGP